MSTGEGLELIEPFRDQDQDRDLGSQSNQVEVNPPQDAVSVEDVPPNGGYGWVCTACVFMFNTHS